MRAWWFFGFFFNVSHFKTGNDEAESIPKEGAVTPCTIV